MKRKRPWKPGGRPRRAVGSMSLNRKKARQTAQKIRTSRKEATAHGTVS